MKREWPALIFAMLLPSALCYAYFVALAGMGTQYKTIEFAYPVAKVLQFVLPVVYLWCLAPQALLWARPRFTGIGIGVGFGLVVGIAIQLVAWFLNDTVLADTPARVRVKVAEFGVESPRKFIALAVFLSAIHSLLEEYYWRWFVHARLRTFMSFAPAAILSGLTFSAHHIFVLNEYLPGRFWSATVPFTLGIAVGGMVWAWLYEKSRSLLGPWISHALVDAAIMYVGYRMVFGG